MRAPVSIYCADLVHPYNHIKTFPYGVACVGAHAAAHLGDRARVTVYADTAALGAACAAASPAILALSNYVWNLELTYAVVREAKAAAPDTIVVLGGPNYPNDAAGQQAFLARYPLVDFYVYKEGELPFLALVEALLAADLDAGAVRRSRPDLPGVHYLDGETLVAPPPPPRTRDLDTFPSPYLAGMLDACFGRPDLTPLVQTKRGCPFQCTFCVEGEEYYTKLAGVTTSRFRAELEYIAARAAGGSPILHIADSNFGMYTHDLELCDAINDIRARYGWPTTVEVSTGKNRKERVLEAVARTGGAMRFGPALQTTDRQTLVNIKRDNISEQVLMEMASAATAQDQRSYTELILGLPGETVASHQRSIQAAMDAGMQRIRMYPLMLLPGTELADAETRRKFQIETRFRIFPQCHGTHRFLGAPFPSVEVAELVIGTYSMPFPDYLAAKRFDLTVEIFYNDLYLEELHGLVRALGLSMFDVVRRCHEQLPEFPAPLRAIYDAIERGVTQPLFPSRDACLAYYRDPAHVAEYARTEYQGSLGILKALALVEHIEPILTVAQRAVRDALAASGRATPSLQQYVEEVVTFSLLRRHRILDTSVQPEGTFHFDFDRIGERAFRVEPEPFRLSQARAMRFRHDPDQARALAALCETEPDPYLRARAFIYPRSDPGTNPYLRRGEFA